MRKLMWFSIGFGAAIIVAAYLLIGSITGIFGAIFAVAAIGCGAAARKVRWMRIPGVIALGISVGLLWFWVYDGLYLSPARNLDGVTTKGVIEIIDYSFSGDNGTIADGNALWDGRQYRIRLYLHEDTVLEPGDLVTGTFDFRITDKGGNREPTFHRGNGIKLLAYHSGAVTVQKADAPWWEYPVSHLRHEMLSLISRIFPDDTESFARALLLGDDNDIGYEMNTAFKVTGVRHIIAVSGLHVTILFGLIYLLTARKRLLTTLFGIPLVLLFAALAGFTPSVVRASIMHIFMVVADLFDREYDAPTAMGFAAVAILTTEPLAATSVSFQLSFGCVAGILLFYEPIRSYLLHKNRLGRYRKKPYIGALVRGFASSVSVSIGAVSLTTPLCAMYFGTVSLVSPLTNLLVLWMVTFVFYGIMAACAVGSVFLGAGQVMGWVVSWGIRYIEGVCKGLARIPLAAVYTNAVPIVLWLVFVYVLVGLLLLFRKKRPLITLSLAILGLCVALIFSWIPPMQDQCRMTVLDVGQGQSIILQSKGRTFLVDCGGSYDDEAADMAAEQLLSMGINRIDGMILTHYDADHAGGVTQFLTRIRVDSLYFPQWEENDPKGQRLGTLDGVCLVDRDMVLQYDTAKITLITSKRVNSRNESSLCVLFQTKNCDILLTGDRSAAGELELLERMDLPRLEVLVAGHHGSKYSTSQALLDATQPQVVVISVGANNGYGHPAQELLDRLAELGCTVFRTDLDGTILIRR